MVQQNARHVDPVPAPVQRLHRTQNSWQWPLVFEGGWFRWFSLLDLVMQRVCERESWPLLKFTEQERHGLNMFKLIKMLAWLEGYLDFHWPVESFKPCMPSGIVYYVVCSCVCIISTTSRPFLKVIVCHTPFIPRVAALQVLSRMSGVSTMTQVQHLRNPVKYSFPFQHKNHACYLALQSQCTVKSSRRLPRCKI